MLYLFPLLLVIPALVAIGYHLLAKSQQQDRSYSSENPSGTDADSPL